MINAISFIVMQKEYCNFKKLIILKTKLNHYRIIVILFQKGSKMYKKVKIVI